MTTETPPLNGEDRRLVDLVTAALVDPNVHTDQRMRLSREIDDVLRHAHARLRGAAGGETHERAPATSEHHLPKVLEAVLVDPNLHTDDRMRIFRDIERMLHDARRAA